MLVASFVTRVACVCGDDLAVDLRFTGSRELDAYDVTRAVCGSCGLVDATWAAARYRKEIDLAVANFIRWGRDD